VWGSGLRATTPGDFARISRTLLGSGLFADESELAAFVEAGAWRIQVGDRGVLVVLERWRAHLDALSMRALWCAASRVPGVVEHLRELAGDRGFGSLLSPVVADAAKSSYEAAGMRVAQELVSYGTASPPPALADPLPVRPFRPEDFERVCEIDAACFDEFWHYDPALLKRYLYDERATVVECEGNLAGFAFCSVRGGEGVLGWRSPTRPRRTCSPRALRGSACARRRTMRARGSSTPVWGSRKTPSACSCWYRLVSRSALAAD
jgi:hypothetical protein